MRNDNNRRRNHRRNDGSEPREETIMNANTAEDKAVNDKATKDNTNADQENKSAETKDKPSQKGQNNGKERNRKDNNRRQKNKVSGERLLKDPGLVHDDDEKEEDREYFDTMTAEELEEVTKMMRKKTATVDKQDLESNVPAGEDWEPYLDMDIRTGVSYEAGQIAANIFHTRGLKGLPNPEHAHCQQYQYSSCKLPSVNWL